MKPISVLEQGNNPIPYQSAPEGAGWKHCSSLIGVVAPSAFQGCPGRQNYTATIYALFWSGSELLLAPLQCATAHGTVPTNMGRGRQQPSSGAGQRWLQGAAGEGQGLCLQQS